MLLSKIVSGGQTGADQGGLDFGKKVGLATGGWAPHGWQTLDGPRPELADYGLKESHGGYAHRTGLNVRDSDGTARFALNFYSPGEICTKNMIVIHKKPFFDISVSSPPPYENFLSWISDNNIKVLNVAGNSEQTAPGIFAFVVDYFSRAFGIS